MTSLAISYPIFGSFSPTLEPSEVALVELLANQISTLSAGNLARQKYYDQKQAFKDFRISTPPQILSEIEAVLGWPAKSVDVLAERISFASFVTTDGSDTDPFGLNEIAKANHFRAEFAGATTSTLINSCAFITISQGLTGEPDVLWLAHNAEEATGLWDRRRRRLRAGFAVLDWKGDGSPAIAALYLPDKTVELAFGTRSTATARIIRNRTGAPLIVHTAFKPNLRRPFGQSRISRAVRGLTDSGMRTIVRSEVGAEFFAGPQRYGIGLDDDDTMEKWTAILGRFITVNRDEAGELPSLGQFPQHSMQPHTDQLRMWANLLAAETSIPVSELGFISDNPASDAAIQSQRDPLRQIANAYIRDNQRALSQLAAITAMLRDGLSEAPDGIDRVSARFEPTVHLTDAGRADALTKQVAILPWLADSPVALEMLGYDAPTIERLTSDKARSATPGVLAQLLAGRTPQIAATETRSNDPEA